MFLLENIYTFFHSIFEILTFRTKPEFTVISQDKKCKNNNNYELDEYEFIMLNET
jgi:hypothetical protein